MNFHQNQLQIAYLQTEFSAERPEGSLWISPLHETKGLSEFLRANKIDYWGRSSHPIILRPKLFLKKKMLSDVTS